jgi:hypothetical protein
MRYDVAPSSSGCSASMPFHRGGHERERPHCRPDLERTRSLSAARKFAIEQRLIEPEGA